MRAIAISRLSQNDAVTYPSADDAENNVSC